MKTRFLPQLLIPGLLCLVLGPVVPPLAAQVPPEFTSRGQPTDQSVSLEVDVLFSARAVGDEPMQYQWRYEGVPLAEATGPTYTIAQVQTEHAGGYNVVVANPHGSVTSRVAILTVDPTFTKLREGPRFPMLEDRANFSGAAWGDYDGDGDLDLFVTSIYSGNHLYRNLLQETGEAGFSRVSASDCDAIRSSQDYSAVWADFNNDGHLDLAIGGVISSTLYRNTGEGQLRWLAHLVGEGAMSPGFGVGAAWGDLDNDGFLDLSINLWAGPLSAVFRNQDGTHFNRFPYIDLFSGNALSGVWSDFDGDGDLDLFAVNIDGRNAFWLNDGDDRLRRDPDSLPGQSAYGCGAAWADFDNDGRADLFVANGRNSPLRNALYWNEGPDGFTVVTSGPPVDEILPSLGVALGDYDNDGWIDIYVANQTAPNTLYRNLGGRQFERVTTGSLVTEVASTVTPCWVDFDHDGDLDLFATSGHGGSNPASYSNVFYRNNGNDNHWIRIRCVGGQRPGSTARLSNRDGIGTKVRLEAVIRGETIWQMREITGGSGMSYSQPLEAHFGLGDATRIETLRVEWSSGMVQVLKDLPVDTFVVVEEAAILLAGLSFSEGGGPSTFNFGSLAGCGAITREDGYPVYSAKVPTGPWAPPNNRVAMDFGVIAEGQGGRAIDLPQACGPVEAFTIAGWLNARDLRAGPGGNRILCALSSPDGPGLELVQQADGSLRLGVNQAAEVSPVRSAAGRITEDPEAAAGNWVFFAVAYDGTQTSGNARFYFGTADQAAQPDADAIDYDRGMVAGWEGMTVGNRSPMADGRDDTGPTGCRGFRGLVDEIEVLGKALGLEEIQGTQRAPAQRAAFVPDWTVNREGDELVLEWDAARSFQVQQCVNLRGGRWSTSVGELVVEGFRHTFRRPINPTTPQMYYRLSGY